MNFLAKVVKKNVWVFKITGGLLLFIKILLKTAKLFSKHFPPGLSLVSFISLFIKARILLQFLSQAFIKGVVGVNHSSRELLTQGSCWVFFKVK